MKLRATVPTRAAVSPARRVVLSSEHRRGEREEPSNARSSRSTESLRRSKPCEPTPLKVRRATAQYSYAISWVLVIAWHRAVAASLGFPRHATFLRPSH